MYKFRDINSNKKVVLMAENTEQPYKLKKTGSWLIGWSSRTATTI